MGNPRPHRITADEYYRMGESHLFAPDARIELIDGVIIDMPSIGNPHMSAVDRLNHMLIKAIDDRAIVRGQGSIRLGDYSVPQPDIALLKPRADFYRARTATAADVLLVIEVSDTSLRFDLDTKAPLYAKHGVGECWILDVLGRKAHIYRSLQGKTYRDISVSSTPGKTTIEALPAISLDLSFLTKF